MIPLLLKSGQDRHARHDASCMPGILFPVEAATTIILILFPLGEAQVNMVLNVHRNHKAYYGRGEGGWGVEGGGGEGDCIPVATLSPP